MFARLSISQRIHGGFLAMVVIITALIGISYVGFARMQESTRWNVHTYDVLRELDLTLQKLVDIETGMRGYVITGREEFLEPLKNGVRDFGAHVQRLADLTADNREQQQRIAELRALEARWEQEDIQPILAQRQAQAQGAPDLSLVARVAEARDKVKMDGLRKLVAQMADTETTLLGVRDQALEAANRHLVQILCGGGVVAAILALIISLSLGRGTRGRLQVAIDAANAVAEGRLNTAIDTNSNDELPRALARMQGSLRDMVQQIGVAAHQLGQAVTQINGASQQLAGAATEQSSSASSMAATIEELSVSISHVTESAEEAHRLSAQSGQQSSEGGEVIQATVYSMNSIAQTVQKSAEQISELGQHSDHISSIVSVIQGIADQTNLLALNAAIEAARAGEQGRGFAVVADEVRLLAQRTANSTQEIAGMIEKIQEGVRQTVSNMQVGVSEVERGVDQAAQAGDAIIGIRDGSTKVVQVVDQISFALREQNAASQDVARSVEKTAQMSERDRAEVQSILHTSESLADLARGLERQVARFSL
ncbi:methyl-accepting chemotaxis protein [Pseudomonas oryzihabitans]|uniref:methyl-accepting chemotaxis protein n=1 Tax=Pseudomonas oryzihabitans TaxID=47885 RepID=UPI0028951C3D|nr:methyl-accepting chemotaxis protein [Pseudomonas oryzihabitans]MDT3718233.1 methyl-accepting chemotaxis protein [Pseudomonas oryzihabitans]